MKAQLEILFSFDNIPRIAELNTPDIYQADPTRWETVSILHVVVVLVPEENTS